MATCVEYLTFKTKVKDVDDLDENWRAKVACEHPYMCTIWRIQPLFTVCITTGACKPRKASVHEYVCKYERLRLTPTKAASCIRFVL